MHIYQQVKDRILNDLDALVSEGVLASMPNTHGITVEPTKDIKHGEMACNAAMVLAGQLKISPRELAAHITNYLMKHEDLIAKADIAGPGFINITLHADVWYRELLRVVERKEHYGRLDIGKGEKVNVEYVSANPTGPMHIGHARGAVYGDALASLLDVAGFNVTREYYINDAGSQVDVLARSAYIRYAQSLGKHDGDIPEGLYPGEYLVSLGNTLAEEFGDAWLGKDEEAWLALFRDRAIDAMMALIRDDLAQLGVHHEVFTSERQIQEAKKIEEGLQALKDLGLIYRGVLEPPKGKLPEDWEEREQTLFKASEFGDDVDRPLQKSDGSWTYFASDVAYHLDKITRKFTRLVVVLGADHGGYVKRLNAVVKALSNDSVALDVKLAQLVNFLENGQPLKMSKRAGNFTTVRDVIDDVGKDVTRFIMLTRKNDAVLDFDLSKVKEQSKDNPVFYVQYAHARAHSVFKRFNETFGETEMNVASSDALLGLDSAEEKALLRRVVLWPRLVEAAAKANEPHRIAFYLQELAADFHSLWNKGKDDVIMRFVLEDNVALSQARMVLLHAMVYVIRSGLTILGVDAVEEM